MYHFYSILGNGFFIFSLLKLRRQKEISSCLVTLFTRDNEDKAKELHAIFKC